jgi:hypothetical protein
VVLRGVHLTIHVHPVSSCWKREILYPLHFYLHYLNINGCFWKPFQSSRNPEACLPTGNSCNAESDCFLSTSYRQNEEWTWGKYDLLSLSDITGTRGDLRPIMYDCVGTRSSGVTYSAPRQMRIPAVTLRMLHLNSLACSWQEGQIELNATSRRELTWRVVVTRLPIGPTAVSRLKLRWNSSSNWRYLLHI